VTKANKKAQEDPAMPMKKWVRNLRGESVVLTGGMWIRRADIRNRIRRHGGVLDTSVKVTTTVLVRGESHNWKYGDHGIKERQAAQLVRDGIAISLIHEPEFRKLLEKGRPAKVADRIAGEPVQWLAAATKRQFERAAAREGTLDREHTVLGRTEQSYLRHLLFGKAKQGRCSLCNRSLPVGLLVAAHLKERSECTRRERLDAVNIVAPMCVLGCDALYERGLVAVDQDGFIRSSNAKSCPTLNAVLRRLKNRKCSSWDKARSEYFQWHLTRRFLGINASF
jgi:hypothetical protein